MKTKSKATIIHQCPDCGTPYPTSRKRCYVCHPGRKPKTAVQEIGFEVDVPALKSKPKASPALTKAFVDIATIEPTPPPPTNGRFAPDVTEAAEILAGFLMASKGDVAELKAEVAELRQAGVEIGGEIRSLKTQAGLLLASIVNLKVAVIKALGGTP